MLLMIISSTQCEDVVKERELFKSVLQHRAQLLYKSAVTNMKLELEVKGLSQTLCAVVILCINNLMRKILESLNDSLRLQKTMEWGSQLLYVCVFLARIL